MAARQALTLGLVVHLCLHAALAEGSDPEDATLSLLDEGVEGAVGLPRTPAIADERISTMSLSRLKALAKERLGKERARLGDSLDADLPAATHTTVLGDTLLRDMSSNNTAANATKTNTTALNS